MSTITGSSLSSYASPTPVSSPFIRPFNTYALLWASPSSHPYSAPWNLCYKRPTRTERTLGGLEYKGAEARKSRIAHEAHIDPAPIGDVASRLILATVSELGNEARTRVDCP
ncbi:hypothetical protein BDQ17DRAFT_1436680 [Cyathus striatus]|nr:hypothetical protein BDQ17DRAFT_1436680 [Cyathus striatus]